MPNPFDMLLEGEQREASTWRWATVTSVDPLRIRLDQDLDPLDLDPVNLAGHLTEGTRVWVQLHQSKGMKGALPVIHSAGGSNVGGVFLLDEIELSGGSDNQVSNRLHIPSQGEYKKFVVTVSAGINELGSGEVIPLMVRPNNDPDVNFAANASVWTSTGNLGVQNIWGTAFPRTGWVGAYPGSLEITFTVNRSGWWAWTSSGWANLNGSGAMITSGGRWNGSSVVDFLQVRVSNTGQTWRPNSFAQLWGHR